MSFSRAAMLAADRPPSALDPDSDARAYFRPIVAGARARGVADAFEMLGLGAVLIDATGRILHATDRARRLIGGYARIIGDHLIAERNDDNAAVQRLVSSAIGMDRHDPGERITFAGAPDKHPLVLRAIRFASEDGEAQRLRAVLVLEDGTAG